MNRIIKIIILTILFPLNLFAEDTKSSIDEPQNSFQNTQIINSQPIEKNESKKKAKVFGITPSLRFSIIGVEPSIALNIFNLEMEGGAAIQRQFGSDYFGFAPIFSVGYNSKPFTKGYQNFIGASYIYLTENWMKSTFIGQIICDIQDKNTDVPDFSWPEGHIFAINYRGAFQWASKCNLNFRVLLPLAMYYTDKENPTLITIADNIGGFGLSWLCAIASFSIGFKVTI